MAAEEETEQQPTTEDKKEIKQEEEEAAAAKKEDGEAQASTPKEPIAAETKPTRQPRLTVHKPDFQKDVVYLYQFSRTPVLPSLSPYCLKVETWLRLAGLKYENVDHKMKFRSKKGQLPFIELNGEEIADSTFIIRELGKRNEQDLDASLTEEQKNIAHAMIAMIENRLCWVYVWWRSKFTDSMLKGYKLNLQHVLNSKIPNGLLNFVFKLTYSRRSAKMVKAHGLGVHKPEDIYEFGQKDLQVLSNMLGDKPFFFGDEPTNLDVVAFANLTQIHFIDKEIPYPLRDWMEENCANLIGHISRMKERCFPDWEEMCSNLDLNSHLPKPVPEVKQEEEKDKEDKEKESDEKEGEKIEKDEKDVKEGGEDENKEEKQENEKEK